LAALPQIDEEKRKLSADDFHLFDSTTIARGYATILV
jgi:hypothetical protein